MDWNHLRDDWQARRTDPPRIDALRPQVHDRLWRRVRVRDLVETAVAIPLLVVFAAAAVRLAHTGLYAAAVFSTFLVGAIAYIPYRLWRARRAIPVPDPSRPVVEFLEAERAALQAQAAMLSKVARWYWGPIAVGVIGFYTSVRGVSLDAALYAGFVVLLCVAIEAANRAAVRKRFRPAIERVEAQLELIQADSDT